MFQKKEEKKEEPVKNDIEELKELLLTESNVNDETGILQIVRAQLTSDLHQRKIGRAIEILRSL